MNLSNIFSLCLLSILFIELCLGLAPEVNTTSGVVSGNTVLVLNTDVNHYYNIPFAEPPVGALRFAKSVPLKKAKEGVINGTKWSSNSCETNEDCLVLNVFAAAVNQTNAPLKPVMFWIYGGAFEVGSASGFDGSALAANGVVFVVPNYRLNAFGFLYGDDESAPGNAGLYDQTLALKWVRDNIHLFGGDKDKVTIFGQSAGSMSVSSHILSPVSKGLFKRAIMESGAQLGFSHLSLDKTIRLKDAKDGAKQLNCTGDQWLDCLRKLDFKTIKAMHYMNKCESCRGPVEGTEFIPVSVHEAFKTGKYNQDIDLIAGNNQNEEGAQLFDVKLTRTDYESKFISKFKEFFPDKDPKQALDFYFSTADKDSPESLERAYNNLRADSFHACDTYLFAKLFATNTPKSNVYYYQLNYNGVTQNRGCNGSTQGVCHGSEVAFIFGDPIRSNNAIQLEKDFSIEMMKLWTEFAKTGKPTTDSHKWPQLLNGTQTPKVKELNAFNYYRVYDDLYHYTCDGFYKDLFPI